jgi:Bacterial SH3 domain
MTHLIYDPDQQFYNDSAGNNSHRYRGNNSHRFNGSFALLAIGLLVILLFWVGMPRLSNNLNTVIIPAVRDSVIRPIPDTVTRSITDNRYVVSASLNMREAPINDARVSYILPNGATVTLLGESHQGTDGDVWLKVSVETSEGRQVGWVRQRYLT